MRSQYDSLTQDDKEKLKMIQKMMAKEKVNYAKGGEIDKNLTYKGDVVGYRGDSKRPQFLGKISIPKNSTPKSIIELAKSKFKRTWYVEVSKDGEYLYEIADDTYYDPNNPSANEYPMITSYAKGGEVKKSEKYGSEYKKEDGQLLFRPINTKEEWSEVSDKAFNMEERKDFDEEMSRIFKKGGSIEEVYLVQVEWKQLNDKGLLS